MENSKKILLAITLLNTLILTSCSIQPVAQNNPDSGNAVKTSGKNYYTVDLAANKPNNEPNNKSAARTGVKLSLVIDNPSFQLKAGGNPAATVSQIKSYQVYLCTSNTSPVSTQIAGSTFSFNRDLSNTNAIVTFSNVPVGGPYYAVASAYDNTVANSMGTNITRPTNFSGTLQPVAVSSNSVTVNPDYTLSPQGVTLFVPLPLRDASGNSVSTSITPVDGSNGLFGNI